MAWADSDYGYKKKITIDHDKVAGDETDFPILISVTDGNLADTANGGHIESSSGYDIVFYDSTENTLLKHEIERYVNTNGLLVFWVKIPSISGTSDTDLYIYYGKSGVTVDPSSTDTWNANFLGVYHLTESAGANCNDSTSNGNDGTYVGNLPTQIAAKIGYGQDLDGDGDRVELPVGCHSPLEGTVEFWVSQDDGTPTGYFYNRDPSGSIADYIVLYFTEVQLEFYNDGDWNIGGSTASSTLRYFSIAWEDGAQNFRINNASIGTAAATPPNFAYTDIRIGDIHLGTQGLDGKVDELRLSNIKRTDAWRDTTYETQNDPAAFMGWGGEEPRPVVVPRQTVAVGDPLIF